MPEKWTGDVVGEMHTHRIKKEEMAAALHWHPKYFSRVINGHKRPVGAEQKIRAALAQIIADREEADTN